MKSLLSSEDRRLFRRAGGWMAYLWAVVEILFVAGVILPSVHAGAQGLAGVATSVGVGLLASLMFALVLGAASMFMPEAPPRRHVRLLMGFVGLGLGVLAVGVSAVIVLEPAFGTVIGTEVFGVLVVLMALNVAVGAVMFGSGYRRLQAALLPPLSVPR